MNTKRRSSLVLAFILAAFFCLNNNSGLFYQEANAALYDGDSVTTIPNVAKFSYMVFSSGGVKQVAITGIEPASTGVKKIEIPSKIGDLNVTYLGSDRHTNSEEPLLENNTTVEEIVIPSTVTTIGKHAFQRTKGLKTVTIPSSVANIGDSAFAYCSSLANLTISNGVKTIGVNSFMSCTSLTTVTLPSSITKIGSKAFNGCSNLKTIIVNCSQTVYQNGVSVNAFPSSASPTYSSGEEQTNQQTEAYTEATTVITEASTEATTESTTFDNETVEMPTEAPTEATTFVYDSNGFAGYYDESWNYIEAYQPCELDSERNAFKIENAGNLYWFADYINSGLGVDSGVGAVLMNDITDNYGVMDGTNSNVRKWTPIGATGGNGYYEMFYGQFDGQNHIISGLYCDSKTDDMLPFAGLFGFVSESGKVTNVCIVNSYFKGAQSSGSIVGFLSGSIGNCVSADNTISAYINAGGIAGGASESASVIGNYCMDSTVYVPADDNSEDDFGNGIVGQARNHPAGNFFHNVTVKKDAGGVPDEWEGVTEIPAGDVTLDGKVTMIDAVSIQNLTYSKYSIVSRSGDMDNDNTINQKDTAFILKAVLEQVPEETPEADFGGTQ